MNKLPVHILLERTVKIRSLLVRGITRGELARDTKGNRVDHRSRQAKCWCVLGAILAVCKMEEALPLVTEFVIHLMSRELPLFQSRLVRLTNWEEEKELIADWNNGATSTEILSTWDIFIVILILQTARESDGRAHVERILSSVA